MKTEENVYEETTRTEDTTAVEGEKASTVPGKFKDVDALVRAYGSLQAEFTRRSQRLKELEKMTENLEKDGAGGGRSGVEKLRKNAKARQEESKQFDQFIAETEEVNAQENQESTSVQDPERQEDQPSIPMATDGEKTQDAATMSATNVSVAAENARKGEGERVGCTQDGDLYEQVSRDEGVRLKIIGEYLASIARSGAPLMTGGAGLLAAPPQRPKSISDAGNMALSYFKKPKVN